MKRLVALDQSNNRRVVVTPRSGTAPLVEPYRGMLKPTHVLMPSHHDSHTHPVFYSLLFGALNPVMLNESTDKQEIMSKLRERARQSNAPLVAYEYKLTAGITAKDLEEFEGYVLLADSSLHSAVANGKLLDEIKKRQKPGMIGDVCSNGISEDYQFLALAIVEEQVQDKGVEEAVRWVKNRISEGTTSMDEKIILTETQWEIFKEVYRKVADELGYQPITSVHIAHSIFVQNPAKYASEAESLGVKAGVKWVGDGGLGSKTAALTAGAYVDGSKGQLTVPAEYSNDYAAMLRDNGVKSLAFHAIGDKTIGIALNTFSKFRAHGITVSIEHFELPTVLQIALAAKIGVPLNMQLNYSTEVWRYEPWMGDLVNRINPMRNVLEAYSTHGNAGLIRFGTDGMPQSMLFAIACGVNHPLEDQRISIDEAIRHSADPRGQVLIKKATYDSLTSMDLRTATENREAAAAELHRGITMVMRDGLILKS